jgi:hypothetical protein
VGTEAGSNRPNDCRFLNLFSLVAIAIAHPLQEQLARNPEFFVVKNSEPVDIITLTIFLSLVIPLLMIVFVTSVGLLLPRAKLPVFYGIQFLLLNIAASTAMNRVIALPALLHLLISGSLAAFIVYGYSKFDSIRSSFPYLGVAILLVPAFFLGKPSIRKLIFPQKPVSQSMPRISSTPPIVFVLWDELPLVSLLDQKNQIDARLYPNLASFSQKSYWFRNASAVSGTTDLAVTAILTGNYPKGESLPIAYDYPANLFTMLKGSYSFKVVERATRLCPTELCKEQGEEPGYATRMGMTLQDLSAIFLHIVLPLQFEDSLPDISKDWGEFWESHRDRVKEFQFFLDSIEETNQPTLYFVHSGLPHTPWSYRPSRERQAYISDALSKQEVDPVRREMLSDFRSHLMQVAYVDELIGKLMRKLHSTVLYDRSLIIITADHGIALKDKENRRRITAEGYRDVILVPLFIKIPDQQSGMAIDRNVETVDVVPTIAELLKTKAFWADGTSALDLSGPERKYKTVYADGIRRFEAHLNLQDTLKKEFFPN